MRHWTRVFVACVWLAVSCGQASAATNGVQLEYIVRAWQTEDGLPQNSVRCLVQTRDGYLWLGTFDGLVRFDGVRFTTFTLANVPELRSHHVNALYEDRHGTLWIGTEMGGLSYYEQGRFGTVANTDGLSTDTIWRLAEDATGTLWVGSPDGLFHSEGRRFRKLPLPKGSPQGIVNAQPGKNGQVWLWGDGGVYLLQNGHFIRYAAGTNGVTALAVDPTGEVWCWVNRLGLLQIGKAGVTHHAEVTGDWATSILCARDGALWLGDRSRGLMRWQAGQTHVYTTADGLAANEITAVMEDREGNLWAGSNGGGLHRLRKRMVHGYSTRDGLSSDDVMSVCAGSEGQVWVGTFGGGLNLLEAGRIRHYQWPYSGNVVALCQVPNGPLWVGTYAHGLVRWQGDQLTKPENPCGSIVRALYRDRRGRLWVGSGMNGLHCLDDGRWTTYSTTEGLSHQTVTCLLEDRAGQMWIGTPQGLNRLTDGRFTRFGRTHGLPVEAIHSLFEDLAGTLWVGTSGGGLARYRGGRFSSITTRHGLANDVIAQILEDDFGFLWLGSNGGIMRAARLELNDCADGKLATVQCFRYGHAEGLLKAECAGGYQPACMKARDGQLRFCTVGGLVVVDPARVSFNSVVPPVFIEEVRIDKEVIGGQWSVATGRRKPEVSALSQQPRTTNHGLRTADPSAIANRKSQMLDVPPRTHRLEFHYTALTFTAPERARFRYRLDGWDKGWIDAGTRRAAYYTRVAPGSYLFRVTACNDSGVWNETGASLGVVVAPAFHQTWWFRLLVAVAVGGLVWGLFQLRVSRLKQLARLRGRIAGDLHDEIGSNLGGIILLSELTQQTPALPPDAQSSLQEINATAQRTASAMRDIVWFLNPDFDTLADMVARMREFASTLLSGGECEFTAPELASVPSLPLEFRRNVFFAFKEILHNIVKHAGATRVSIQLEQAGRQLTLRVRDNGRGFDPTAASSGHGLRSLRQRAADLGGQLALDSEPGKGTSVTLTAMLP